MEFIEPPETTYRKEFEKPDYNEKDQVLESVRGRFERGAYQLYDHELISLLL